MENKNIQNGLAPLCGGEKKGEISLYTDGKLDTMRREQPTWKTRLFSVWWEGTENYVGSLDEVFTSKKDVVLTEKDIQRLAKGNFRFPGSKTSLTWAAV